MSEFYWQCDMKVNKMSMFFVGAGLLGSAFALMISLSMRQWDDFLVLFLWSLILMGLATIGIFLIFQGLLFGL